jgi:ribokinase
MDIMKTAGNLVVLGSINADHILNLESFPTPGETVTGTSIRWHSAVKAQTRPSLPGAAGRILRLLPARVMTIPVNAYANSWRATTSILRRSAWGESTGVALIFVNAEGENVIGIHAALTRRSDGRVEAQERIARRRAADAAGVAGGKRAGCGKIAHENHTTVVLNPAPARVLSDELLALVDIITPNETEAEKLTGIRVENDDDAARRRVRCMTKALVP